MTNNKYVIVLRHGPTHSNETINYNSFVNFTSDLIVYLTNFLSNKGLNINNITPKIYTSPFPRCKDTGKLLASYLEVLRNNKKINVGTDEGVKRWDAKNETREMSIKRANNYGNNIFKKITEKNDPCVYIYVSHSSVIPSLISGIVGRKLKKIKLHTACLSIININERELEVFNKSFKE
jgi:broad specificity phosphatase PhoE